MVAITYDERKILARDNELTMTAMVIYEEVLATFSPGKPVKKRTIADIARQTGMARPTVKKLLSRLQDAELIEDRDGYYIPVGKEKPTPQFAYPQYGGGHCCILRDEYGNTVGEIILNPAGVRINGQVASATLTTIDHRDDQYWAENSPLDTRRSGPLYSSTLTDPSNVPSPTTLTDLPTSTLTDPSTGSLTGLLPGTLTDQPWIDPINTLDRYPTGSLTGSSSGSLIGTGIGLLGGPSSPSPSSSQPVRKGCKAPDRRTCPDEITRFNRLIGNNKKRAAQVQEKIRLIKESQERAKNNVSTSPVVPTSTEPVKTFVPEDDTLKSIDDTPPWDVPYTPWNERPSPSASESNPSEPLLYAPETPSRLSDTTPTPSLPYKPLQSVTDPSKENTDDERNGEAATAVQGRTASVPGHEPDPTPTGSSLADLPNVEVTDTSWHGIPTPEGYTWSELFLSVPNRHRLERVLDLGPEHWEVRRRYTIAQEGTNAYLRYEREDDPLDTFDPTPYTSVHLFIDAEMPRLVAPLDPNEPYRGRGLEYVNRWKARANRSLTFDDFLEKMLMGDMTKPDISDPQYHMWLSIFRQRKEAL